MKKVFFIFILFFTVFSVFSQDLGSKGVTCFSFTEVEQSFIDLVGIPYCNPLIRTNMNDSIKCKLVPDYIINQYNKYLSSDSKYHFSKVPNTKKIVQTGRDFINKEQFFDEYSADLADMKLDFFDYVVTGKQEYENSSRDKTFPIYISENDTVVVNTDKIVSILIVEVYFYTKNQISPSLYLRHESGKLIDPGAYFDNFADLHKKGML
jgi:hypothetical protein